MPEDALTTLIRRFETLQKAFDNHRLHDLPGTGSGGGAVPTTRTISAGPGLTGGGDLSANRTISISGDTILIYKDGEVVAEYATLTLALAAVASGQEIGLPIGVFSEDFTIPAGVGVIGLNRVQTVLTGTIAPSAGSFIGNLTLHGTDKNSIVGPSSPAARVMYCDILTESTGTPHYCAVALGGNNTLYLEYCKIRNMLDGVEVAPFAPEFPSSGHSNKAYMDQRVVLPDPPYHGDAYWSGGEVNLLGGAYDTFTPRGAASGGYWEFTIKGATWLAGSILHFHQAMGGTLDQWWAYNQNYGLDVITFTGPDGFVTLTLTHNFGGLVLNANCNHPAHTPITLGDIWIEGDYTGATPIYGVNVYACQMNIPGGIHEPGDCSAFDAVAYAPRHTNDTDTALTAIHHTLGTGPFQAAAGNRGLPTGGTATQVMAKIDGTDYNVHWIASPQSIAPSTNNFLTGYDATTGAFSAARPTWANVDKTVSSLDDIATLSVSRQLTSTLAVGTAPFAVTSTTLVSNLNADLLDGHHWADVPIGIPAAGSTTQLLQWASSGVAKWITVSGDVTIADGGSVSIGALKVTNAMIAASTIDLTAKVTGILPSANGGTGINNGGRTLTISANSGTLSFTSAVTLTVAATASISGSNTGDQSLPIGIPAGGSVNQILKNSGVSGTAAWGTVTESSGALASVTTLSMSGQLTSTLATGTAPLVVASTTMVTNLNADLLDGHHWSEIPTGGSVTSTNGAVGRVSVFSTATNLNGQDSLFFDATNRAMFVGKNAQPDNNAIADAFTVTSETGAPSSRVVGFGNTATGPTLSFWRGRGTWTSQAAVLGSDQLGSITWSGKYDTNTGHWNIGASIRAVTSENWSGIATGANVVISAVATGATSTVDMLTVRGDQINLLGPIDMSSATNQWLKVGTSFAIYGPGASSSYFKYAGGRLTLGDPSYASEFLFSQASGSPLFISTAGKVGIGTATFPSVALGQTFEIDTSNTYGGMAVGAWSTGVDVSPIITMQHSKSNTIGTHVAVTGADSLGYLIWRGSDGSAFQDAGYIKLVVDNTGVSAGHVPGKMLFATSSPSVGDVTAMTIDSAQKVSVTSGFYVGGDGGGIAGTVGFTSSTFTAAGPPITIYGRISASVFMGYIRIYIGTTAYYIPYFGG